MPGQELARQWFIPGDGIDRHVISADIQRYLGNDATVRPGRERNNEGVEGYWIRAYRNLTSAMISDLRADSARWRQEKAATGGREPYVGSQTYERGNASQSVRRRDADSPSMPEGPYGVPPAGRAGRGQVDAMQIDPPVTQSHADRGRYGHPSAPARGGYPAQPDNGQYPGPGRDRYPDAGRPDGGRPVGRPAYQDDELMTDAYGRAPVSSPYGQDPRYATNPMMPNDNAPPGYVRQGEYFVPVTSGYGQPSVMAPTRGPEQPQQYPPGPYGQPPDPQRDPRAVRGDVRGDIRGDPRVDPRGELRPDPRDPRYGQSDYDASRYYPSPATTAASVGSRDTMQNPAIPSQYGSMPVQYDQYGRPIQQAQAPYKAAEPVYGGTREPPRETRGEPTYGRPAPPPASNDRDRDNRRRRLH